MSSDEKDMDGSAGEGEDTPMNNVDKDVDVKVTRPHRPKAGCYVTRTQAALLAVTVLLLLVVVGVVVGILARQRERDPNDAGWLRHVTPKPTVDPRLPWAGIRLPRDLIPAHYDLQLTIDVDKFKFTGLVIINVTCTTSTKYIIVHANSLVIRKDDISVQETDSKRYERIQDHVSEPINQFYILRMRRSLVGGRQYTLRFGHFEGQMNEDLRGLYRSKYRDSNGKIKYLAASQLQSVDARKVFPCFDEPDLKANFTVSITHRNAYTALSNMPVRKSTIVRNEWLRDEFETTPLMSTYLLAFVVADFRHREKMEDGLTIRIWAQPDMFNQMGYALGFATKAYNFFANYFKMPEVVPKADHVAIPDFSAGAMENWGLVLYRETALLHDDDISSISNKYWVSLVMAHEIAHTWFGNMVTMKWWDDLWLNEGFANTLMYFALDNISPTWQVFDMQLVNNIYPVMTKDALLTSHAISTPIRDPDDIPQYFDLISYDKGMAVLRLLRGFLGWNDFQEGLQTYVKRYKFKNAEMSELWKTFAEVVKYKYKVGEIMDTWTRQMGFPVVTVRHINNGRYRLIQERFLLNPDDRYNRRDSIFEYRWHIPFRYKVEGETQRIKTQWMHLSSAEIQVSSPNFWIIGNVDYMGFYRTNYDESMWKRLIKQLHTNPRVFSAANRAGLISDAFNLARANKLSYEIALNLSSYLQNENDYVPWRAFLDSTDFIKGMLSTSNSYGLFKRYMFKLVAPKFRTYGFSDKGDLLERKLRVAVLQAAAEVDVPDAVHSAKNMFNNWMTYSSGIPPDFASVVYSVGIKYGGEREWDHLWDKSQGTNVASESEVMMNALAFTQRPWLLWRYARWSLDGEKIRMQDIRNLFRYFASTPLGRSVALQFLLTNWGEINRRFGMDAFLLRDIIHATTSLLNTEYQYRQLERLYRVSPPAGVASKAADNSLALIRSNIKWMTLNHNIIYNWLLKNVEY